MSTDRDVTTRIVRSWLHEDAHEDADRILNLVLDEIDTTPQRSASWLVRRFPPMNNNLVRVALAAAAVVLLAIVGFQFLGNSNTGGPGATETPQSTATPEPSGAAPSPSADTGLPVGSSHVLWNAPGDIQISVTIPNSGWFGDEGGGMLVKNDNADPPDGAGLIVFQLPLYVYGDACHWSTTTPDAPVTTSDELIRALEAQTSRDGGYTHEFWNIGGSSGRGVDLDVPEDAVFEDCDGGQFRSWVGDPLLDTDARYHQGPGQIDSLWVGDVNGMVVVFDVAYYAGTPPEVVDELWVDIAHSATFQMP